MFEYGQSVDATTYNYDYQPSVGPYDVQKLNGRPVSSPSPTAIPRDTSTTSSTRWKCVLRHRLARLEDGISFETGYQRQVQTTTVNVGLDLPEQRRRRPTPSSVSVRNTPLVASTT